MGFMQACFQLCWGQVCHGGSTSFCKSDSVFYNKFLNTFFKNMKINSCLHFTDPSYSFCSLTAVFLPASTWVSTLIFLLRYAGVIWLLFLMGYLYFIGLWLGEDQRTHTIKSHVWALSSNFINHSTLNYEHNWEDICIQQQLRASNNHD